jgi:hypothetical protein
MNLKKFYNMGKWEMDDPKGLGQSKRKKTMDESMEVGLLKKWTHV